jgi:hypothetical protein
MKKTAVHELFLKWLSRDLTTEDFEQAKEMEKEQIMRTSWHCHIEGVRQVSKTSQEYIEYAEQYYNETYQNES